MKFLAFSFAFGIFLFACSSSSTISGPAYADARAVSDGLAKAGLGCMPFTSKDTTEPYADSQGTCTVDTHGVRVFTFKDVGAQRNWTGLARKVGCVLAKGLGISSLATVEGNGWIVQPQTETEAKKIADQFGGTAKVYQCD